MLSRRSNPFGRKGSNALRFAALKVTAFGVVLALAGCKTSQPPKPLEQLTPQERAGHNVFLQQCSLCHDDRTGTAMKGPSLLNIYKKQYLPSGAPANDDRITNVVMHGRGMMPAIGGQLSTDDVADLLAYLKTL
jgi:mono/diheme cytochrome c family protein